MQRHRRFQQGSGCYICRICGKRTRATGDEGDLELCAFCMFDSEQENAHVDGCHEDPETQVPFCPLCNTDRSSQITALCKEFEVQPPKEKPFRG